MQYQYHVKSLYVRATDAFMDQFLKISYIEAKKKNFATYFRII